jgi:hypothetical protein
MTFARRVFLIAGIYGLIVLLPSYFLEDNIGRDFPPAITHPEYYYGFIGVAVSWQILFLVLSRDPIRYRKIMIPAILEKVSFGIPAIVLYLQSRLSSVTLGVSLIDFLLGALFVTAYLKTGSNSDG